jgi:hypothetical protein
MGRRLRILTMVAAVGTFPWAWQAAPGTQSPPPAPFSTAAANAALDRIQQGLDAHDAELFLSAFDHGRMAGYSGFRDQIRALFVKYGSFRSFYSISELRAENGRGIVLADFDVEAAPAGDNALPVRTHAQVRFDMAPGPGGWRIVNLEPRSFFS